jgi:probable HAF family extracellular repeat protein
MLTSPRTFIFLLAPLLALPLGASADPVYTVTPIVDSYDGIHIGGAAFTINDSGQMSGMISTQGRDWQAAIYLNGTVTIQNPAGYASGHAYGINDSGTVLARLCKTGSSCSNTTIAGGVITELPGWLKYSNAWFGTSPINNSGQITGALENGPGMYAFLYTPGSGTIDLGFGGIYSWGRAVNDSGAVAGWYADENAIPHAVIYSGGTVHELAATGSYSEANDLNNAGVAVGTQAPSPDEEGHAVMFVDGQVVELGDRGTWGVGSANAINSAGTIVGEAHLLDYGSSAFVYRDGTMFNLSDLVAPGWALGTAWDINDSGQILADGISPDGVRQYVLLTPTGVSPVPEPAQYGALIAGLFIVGASRRRHRATRISAA